MKTEILKKLVSRKFIAAAVGVICGIVLALEGNETEGVTAIVASILGYLAAEGYVDAAALKNNAECKMQNDEL